MHGGVSQPTNRRTQCPGGSPLTNRPVVISFRLSEGSRAAAKVLSWDFWSFTLLVALFYMKRITLFIRFGSVILILFAVCWSYGQASKRGPASPPIDANNNLALDQLAAFVTHLQATKQTNTLKLFNDYSNSSLAQQHSADLGVITGVLIRLRDGRTNEAINLLESRLDSDAVGLYAAYQELPPELQQKLGLKSLEYARDYCAKFPRKRSPHADQALARAFALVDKSSGK